jgi:MFS family permease
MWLIMIPTVVYGLLFLSLRLPHTERVESGVSAKDMFGEALRPLFLIFLFAMLLTAAVELGTNQWIGQIMKNSGIESGILVLAWISLIMLVGRLFAGPVVHKLAPTGVLLASSAVGILGLLWLSAVRTPAMAYAASFVFALGICYFWPTMLGVTSERFPRGGAFLLGLMGAAGMASAGFSQPAMGKLYDTFGPEGALQYVVVLPIALVVIFGLVYLRDRARGGYKVEKLN